MCSGRRRKTVQSPELGVIWCPAGALSFRVPLWGRIATARSVRESAALVLVVPNCMFRVAEGGTFVAGGHVPHKVGYHRACRGESTLQQEEEMYGVRNNGRTVHTVVRRQRCRLWVTLLSLCPRSSRAEDKRVAGQTLFCS